jgi:hypothetical protein
MATIAQYYCRGTTATTTAAAAAAAAANEDPFHFEYFKSSSGVRGLCE